MKGRPAVCGLAGVLLLSLAASAVPDAADQLAFSFQDPEITESSGLAASRRYPGLLWTHNDSGDGPRLFLVNQSGATVCQYQLQGARAFDWEDMAVVGSGNHAKIYVGDIGDNRNIRTAVFIYRVAEPEIDARQTGQNAVSGPADRMIVKFPDGPRDAETLLADPNGYLYILSKSPTGTSRLYRTPKPFTAGEEQTLDFICELTFRGQKYEPLPTSGDFSPDGTKLAVTTYNAIYEWTLPAPYDCGHLAELPCNYRLIPPLKQCEGLCFSLSGDRLYISTEGKQAPVWQITEPTAP